MHSTLSILKDSMNDVQVARGDELFNDGQVNAQFVDFDMDTRTTGSYCKDSKQIEK